MQFWLKFFSNSDGLLRCHSIISREASVLGRSGSLLEHPPNPLDSGTNKTLGFMPLPLPT